MVRFRVTRKIFAHSKFYDQLHSCKTPQKSDFAIGRSTVFKTVSFFGRFLDFEWLLENGFGGKSADEETNLLGDWNSDSLLANALHDILQLVIITKSFTPVNTNTLLVSNIFIQLIIVKKPTLLGNSTFEFFVKGVVFCVPAFLTLFVLLSLQETLSKYSAHETSQTLFNIDQPR